MNVPLYEILPEENLILTLFALLTLLCYWRFHKRDLKLQQAHLPSEYDSDSTTVLIAEDRDEQDDGGEYRIWVDSVITLNNHRLYMAGCCFAVFALLIYSNLVITTVCHPIPVMQMFSVDILLPDDCTDVYDQYDSALNFTGGLHALLLAFFIACKLIQHMIYISQDNVSASQRTNRNCISNWKSFLCN